MENNNEEKDCYINIQGWMVKKLGLKANELIIYALIHGFCQDGVSYFYGSVKYIMENTNLSKETVLTVLQSLVKKKLIIKKDVKNYQVFDNKRTALGGQHFCLYYTAYSRSCGTDSAGQETVPAESESHGSRNLTGSKNLTRAGQEFVPVAGQEFVPNNLSDNKFDTASSTGIKNTAEEETQLENQIKKKLAELFGYQVNFSPSPVPRFMSSANSLGLTPEESLEYLEWAFGYLKTKCREQASLDGYFYKSFAEPNLMAKFKNISELRKAEEERKAAMVISCPVCGTRHSRDDMFCEKCGLDGGCLSDEREIARHKKIYSMPPATGRAYEAAIEQLDKAYPLSERFHISKMQKEYEHELNLIERMFGLDEDSA